MWQGPQLVLLGLTEAKGWLGMGQGSGVAWHGSRFGLPRLGCSPRMRKLLEFDFSTAVDGQSRTELPRSELPKMKCWMSELLSAKWLLPSDHLLLSWSSSIQYFELCGPFRTGEQLVYHLTLESRPRWVSVN